MRCEGFVKALALVLGLGLGAGCAAVVDVYRYQPRPLPAGVAPLAAVSASLRELKAANWGPSTTQARRARVGADGRGIAVSVYYPIDARDVPPIYLTYGDIARNVRAVVNYGGTWSVLVGHGAVRDVELQFTSMRAARLFLDGTSALAQQSASSFAAR